MITFTQEADSIFEDIVAIRRDIHRHPEPSRHEFRTANLVAERLEALGLEVRRDYAGALPSVVGLLRGGQEGATVALRADMDALHITELTDVPYRSETPGVMHACGHDIHTAALVGAAVLLSRHRQELKGNVKFIFEPAEEEIGGAQLMIPAGVLESPHVDAVFGVHVDNAHPVGSIAVCSGEMMAASDRLNVTIKGRSAHGAYPHLGVDAMLIAAHFLTEVQTMLSREKDTFERAVITFGQIDGGTARNIICDEVRLLGICRTFNPTIREFLNRRVEELLKGICCTFGGSYELERQKSHPALICDSAMTNLVKETADCLLGSEHVIQLTHGSMGCESFAYFAEKRPAAFYRIGTGNPEKGINEPLHSAYFNVDEAALKTAVAMHAAVACNYLEQHACHH